MPKNSPRNRARLVPGLPLAAWLAAAALTGCEAPDRTPAAVARELAGEWSRLEERHEALEQMRQELAAKRQEKPGKDAAEDLAALERRVETTGLDYSRRLAAFLNETADRPETRSLRRLAVRRKSAEELATARRFIEQAGDYRQAIEICERALELDPGNPDLRAALARAREMRFVTPERFARVEEGMSPDEVKAVLGPPNLHNVRELPGNVVAWFFDRDERGAAAGVWFERRQGKHTVYATDFAAVEPGSEAPPTGPPPSPLPEGGGPRA